MKRPLYFLLTCAFTAIFSDGYSAETLSPEKLLSMARIDGAVIAPNGSYMLYQVSVPNTKENKSTRSIFSCALPGGTPAPWGNFQENVSQPAFVDQGKKVAFVKSVNGIPQVFLAGADGSNPMQLTQAPNGVGSFVFSAAGNRLVYTSDVKTTADVHDRYPDLDKVSARIIDDVDYRHWDDWDDYSSTHIFVAELNNYSITGTKELFPGDPFDYEGIALSPDGALLSFSTKKLRGIEAASSTNTDVFLYTFNGAELRNLTAACKGYDKDPVFSPDGKWIAYTSMKENGYEADKAVLRVYDVKTGNDIPLTEAFTESASGLCWMPDASGLYFIAPREGTEQVFAVQLNDKNVRMLTNAEADYTSVNIAGKELLLGKMSMQFPRTYVLFNPAKKTEKEITTNNQNLLSSILSGKVEKNWVKTSDGKKELVWVIYPPNFDPSKKYPALLYCQGGPQSPVSQFYSFRWNFQLMAANGYVVIAPNRRGLPGFGKEWNDAIAGDWGGQAINDYFSAVDSISKRPYIDASRMGAVGASYGGYSVYYLAGCHKKRFKTFISHCGLFNLESWYTMTDELFFSIHDIGKGYWENDSTASVKRFSPHRMVGNWDTPMLVIHGERDYRVPVSEGMQAYGAARMKNLKARFLYIPDEGHWVLKPQNALLWHREFFRWLSETL